MSGYTHKSGAKKRAEKRKREEEFKSLSLKPISSFFSKSEEKNEPQPTELEKGESQVPACNLPGVSSSGPFCLSPEPGPSHSESTPQSTVHEDFKINDPGTWPKDMTEHVREKIVRKGFTEINVNEMKLYLDPQGRKFTKYLLYAKCSNGKFDVKRDWLVWSKSKHKLFCGPCLLFEKYMHKKPKSKLAKVDEGFDYTQQTWQKLHKILPFHENLSLIHISPKDPIEKTPTVCWFSRCIKYLCQVWLKSVQWFRRRCGRPQRTPKRTLCRSNILVH